MTLSKMIVAGVVVACFAIPAARMSAAPSGIIAPAATLQQAGTGYAFTEGPASDKDGNVYFTDQPNDRIVKWSVDGKLSTWLSPALRW